MVSHRVRSICLNCHGEEPACPTCFGVNADESAEDWSPPLAMLGLVNEPNAMLAQTSCQDTPSERN